jgi:hypothetical protein
VLLLKSVLTRPVRELDSAMCKTLLTGRDGSQVTFEWAGFARYGGESRHRLLVLGSEYGGEMEQPNVRFRPFVSTCPVVSLCQ